MRKKHPLLENLEITDYAAEGKSIARHNGKVIFIAGLIPGDKANVQIVKSKKDWAEGVVVKLTEPSPQRQEPFCKHFGICGGCKWQHLPYAQQLKFKQQEAEQNLKRIGKLEIPEELPIIGADNTIAYRNKLEFTFSNKRYLAKEELHKEDIQVYQNALGFHAPRVFDKIIDIEACHLMSDVNNKIRNTIRNISIEKGFEYYDIKQHTGWLRNINIRHTTTGELMVNICMNHEAENDRKYLLDQLLSKVPEITTLLYTINPKWNDTIYDLTPEVYFGKGIITEKLEDLQFIISPKSFFQTNTQQAEKLYSVARAFAGLTGKEIVYDLYCGTGSIGLFLSKQAAKIIGVELIDDAIEDAKKNAQLNNIEHAHFYAGDVIKVCIDDFFNKHGRPDVVITDPPRAGMHEKLIHKLLEMEAPRIVYVSCNTATQARDMALLSEKYDLKKLQTVDMFPHTHHIESVALMTLKEAK